MLPAAPAAAHLPECGKGGAVVDVQDKLGGWVG